MTKANFQTWADLPATQMTPHISRRLISGDKLMSIQLILEEEAIVPQHHHPHEQITHLISGRLEFTAGDEVRILEPGDVVFVPSELPHSGVALEKTVIIEAFSPPREDFLG